jgi:uncharacterized protein YndB with AHSA1/START domain
MPTDHHDIERRGGDGRTRPPTTTATDPQPSAAEHGNLDRSGRRLRLTFVRRLPHDPAKVWRAITEPEHLAAWFPTSILGERAAGAQLRFEFPNGEAPPMHGTMLIFDPPHVLELSWGDEVLRFELEPVADGTELTFVDTFDELGKAARDAAGWHTCLDLLAPQVAGSPAPWDSAERWRQVHPWYVADLGPDASTIGPPQEWIAAHGDG